MVVPGRTAQPVDGLARVHEDMHQPRLGHRGERAVDGREADVLAAAVQFRVHTLGRDGQPVDRQNVEDEEPLAGPPDAGGFQHPAPPSSVHLAALAGERRPAPPHVQTALVMSHSPRSAGPVGAARSPCPVTSVLSSSWPRTRQV